MGDLYLVFLSVSDTMQISTKDFESVAAAVTAELTYTSLFGFLSLHWLQKYRFNPRFSPWC